MYCACTECNVFVCANVHVRSQGFHYILRGGDGWMAFCLFAVSLLRCFVFFVCFFFNSSNHKTCYLQLSSWRGIDYLLRISDVENTHRTIVISQMLSGTPILRDAKPHTCMKSI